MLNSLVEGFTMKFAGLRHQTSSSPFIIEDWDIELGQHWGVFVTHTHNMSLLTKILSGEVLIDDGTFSGLPSRIGVVSLHRQQQLLDLEIAKDDTDFMDRIDYGSTVEALILEEGCTIDELQEVMHLLDLTSLRHRGFRQLSTGETRRLMLAKALVIKPQLLILDEPYSGLDTAHRQDLKRLLERCAQTMQLIVLTSRQEELPSCITHIALFDETQLTQTMTVSDWRNHPVMAQVAALSTQRRSAMLALTDGRDLSQSYPSPRVIMNDVSVRYTDGVIFEHFTWTIEAGEHWQIRGPNGCGKSTLLGLILGDHPQCYSNDITVLGTKRGSGESIWDIKKNIGVVSSSLHLQYRVNCQALEVIVSGYFDSIGLYEQPSLKQWQAARQWLAVLEMSQYEKVGFKALDYGQQRLLLVARALIKQPALLILDEPYQGLDYLSRLLVMDVLNRLAQANVSQLLYVTHHKEDGLSAIDHFVDFVPNEHGGHRLELSRY
jgi:molybdate transport system ATP-binding protein